MANARPLTDSRKLYKQSVLPKKVIRVLTNLRVLDPVNSPIGPRKLGYLVTNEFKEAGFFPLMHVLPVGRWADQRSGYRACASGQGLSVSRAIIFLSVVAVVRAEPFAPSPCSGIVHPPYCAIGTGIHGTRMER